HVTDERILERWRAAQEQTQVKPLEPEDVAHSILYALESPAHVGVNEVVIRPTRQQT
ncbi:MAG: oxidoreductase, partial [Planctomycetota bacterium]